jgi:ApaG protein
MTYQTPPNITVEVETQYVEAQSEPDSERYVFSYTITIRNEGEIPAQLPTATFRKSTARAW